jgi:hypothetical protein
MEMTHFGRLLTLLTPSPSAAKVASSPLLHQILAFDLVIFN